MRYSTPARPSRRRRGGGGVERPHASWRGSRRVGAPSLVDGDGDGDGGARFGLPCSRDGRNKLQRSAVVSSAPSAVDPTDQFPPRSDMAPRHTTHALATVVFHARYPHCRCGARASLSRKLRPCPGARALPTSPTARATMPPVRPLSTRDVFFFDTAVSSIFNQGQEQKMLATRCNGSRHQLRLVLRH